MDAFLNNPPQHDYDRAVRNVNKFSFLSALAHLGRSVGTAGTPAEIETNISAVAAAALLEQCVRVDVCLDSTESADYTHSKHLNGLLREVAGGSTTVTFPANLGTDKATMHAWAGVLSRIDRYTMVADTIISELLFISTACVNHHFPTTSAEAQQYFALAGSKPTEGETITNQRRFHHVHALLQGLDLPKLLQGPIGAFINEINKIKERYYDAADLVWIMRASYKDRLETAVRAGFVDIAVLRFMWIGPTQPASDSALYETMIGQLGTLVHDPTKNERYNCAWFDGKYCKLAETRNPVVRSLPYTVKENMR